MKSPSKYVYFVEYDTQIVGIADSLKTAREMIKKQMKKEEWPDEELADIVKFKLNEFHGYKGSFE
jgi:hypothetical protein